jgi:hypothetical protein
MIKHTMKKHHHVPAVGTKLAVWRGHAKHTSGGLEKKDLMKHKGRVISRKKHAAGKKAIKTLRKLGYIAKKGKFTLFKKMSHTKKKARGGADMKAYGGMEKLMKAFE